MRKSRTIFAAIVAVAAAAGLSSCIGMTESIGWGVDDLWYDGWGNSYYGGYYGPGYGTPPPPPPPPQPVRPAPAPQPPTGGGASSTHRPATISPTTPSGQQRPGSTGNAGQSTSRPRHEQAAPSSGTTTTGRGRK